MSQPQRVVPPVKRVATYRRPMAGWYLRARKPYKFYMIRELSSVVVAWYTLLMIHGLFQLAAGEAAFNEFLALLRSPLVVVLNLFTLGLITFHAISWFLVVPKTMPMVFIRGKRLGEKPVIQGALAGFGVASLAVLIAFLVTAP